MQNNNAQTMNLVMTMEVARMCYAYQHALLRTAGTAGDVVLHELDSVGDMPLCIEIPATTTKTTMMGSSESPDDDHDDEDNRYDYDLVPVGSNPAVTRRTIIPPTWVVSADAVLKFGVSLTTIKAITGPICKLRCITSTDMLDSCRIITQLAAKSVCFTPNPRVQNGTLPPGFGEMTYIEEIDLNGLSYANTLPSWFLCECPNLLCADFTPLTIANLKTISKNCLSACKSLVSVNLSGLEKVTRVRALFLSDSVSLTSIDLRPLRNVTTIEGYFMSNTSLQIVDMTPLVHLRVIRSGFLSGCTKLKHVQFGNENDNDGRGGEEGRTAEHTTTTSTYTPGPNQPITIQVYLPFLDRCRSMETFDMSHNLPLLFMQDDCGGASFLSSCINLKIIVLAPKFASGEIPVEFLSSCTSLKTLDISPFSNLTSIGRDFLTRCNFETIDLTPLKSVTRIGPSFVNYCNQLTSINLSGFINVTTIDESFMSSCDRIRDIDLSAFGNVTEVGGYFLSRCPSITDIDLTGFHNVESLGRSFMAHCTQLQRVNLSAMSKLTVLREALFLDCRRLKHLDSSGLVNVTHYEEHEFLQGTPIFKNGMVDFDTSQLTKIERQHHEI